VQLNITGRLLGLLHCWRRPSEIHDPSNVARASCQFQCGSIAGPSQPLLCTRLRERPCFSRLMNTAISRAASLHLIKRFIARFQGHCSLTNARAYRSIGQPPSTDPSVQKSARYSVMHVLGGFFDSLRLGTYGPVDYPAPLAQPCSCRSLDPTASRFRHAEAEASFHRPNPRTTSPYRQPLAL
jgi:hypothetical protein